MAERLAPELKRLCDIKISQLKEIERKIRKLKVKKEDIEIDISVLKRSKEIINQP